MSGGQGSGMQRHALVVSWGFAPVDSPASLRALSWANRLFESGMAVTALSVDSKGKAAAFGQNDALLRRLIDQVRTQTVLDQHPDRFQLIDRWPRERAEDPAKWRSDWVDRAEADFDEPGFGHVLASLVEAAAQIHQQNRVELVVAIAPAMVMIEVGAQLAKSFDAELLLDFAYCNDADFLIETDRLRSAVETSAEVWVPDQETAARVESAFGAGVRRPKAVGYEDFGPGDSRRAATPKLGEPLNVGCVVEAGAWGSFTETIEGWLLAREQVTELAGATLTVHGILPPKNKVPQRVLSQLDGTGVTFAGPLSALDLASQTHDFDLLMVISRPEMPPVRAANYLATGLRIVWCTQQKPPKNHPLAESSAVSATNNLTAGAFVRTFESALATQTLSGPASVSGSNWLEEIAETLASTRGGLTK